MTVAIKKLIESNSFMCNPFEQYVNVYIETVKMNECKPSI